MNCTRKTIAIALLTILSVFFFCCASASAASVVESGSCGENVTWKLDSEGMLSISGSGKMDDWTSSNLPWYSNRNTIFPVSIKNGVTSIGKYTFYGCGHLTSIVIPDSITTLGERAFYECTSLTSVSIPSSITSIDTRTFSNCTRLTSYLCSCVIAEHNKQKI